jgi:hypothetical protein
MAGLACKATYLAMITTLHRDDVFIRYAHYSTLVINNLDLPLVSEKSSQKQSSYVRWRTLPLNGGVAFCSTNDTILMLAT